MDEEIEFVAVDRNLLEAAINEIRAWKVDKGGDDQVLLNLEAGLRIHDRKKVERWATDNFVSLPKTVGEAELMQKLGFAWLQQNAPERIAEAVRDTTQSPPIGWWYEDHTGCLHMSLDLDLGLQHERQFGYKLNWITSAEPGRWFENFDDIKRLRKLRELCGHVANDSQRTITIGQDDATKDWIIRAGKEWWYGPTLGQAIDAAVVDED